MKLLMENWREFVNEEEELQEIEALKNMMGRLRGGEKSKSGGYGWEAAAAEMDAEDEERASGLWDTIDAELAKNNLKLSDEEGSQIQQLITKQLEGYNLSEGLIAEAGAWETLKHWASKLGRMEKGGKIIGRGKADAENKAKIEKVLSKPAIKLIDDLRDKLESEYPDFPNNKGTAEFGMAVVEIWIVYDSIVDGVKKNLLEPAAANALIRALYDLVDRYKNYELSDVGRHFTESSDPIDEKVGDRIRKLIQRNRAGQDAVEQAAAADEAQAALIDAGVDETVANSLSGVADIPSEKVIEMAQRAAAEGPEAWNEFIQWKIENKPLMHFDLEFGEKLSQAWADGSSVTREMTSMTVTGNTELVKAQYESQMAGYNAGLWGHPGPPPEFGSELIASPETVKSAASAVGERASDAAIATAEQLPEKAQQVATAVAEESNTTEIARAAVEQIDPEKAEEVAQAIRNVQQTMGTGATDLSTMQVAGFWLQNVGLPALLYSKMAIKLLRAKGKHSSRDKELTKLLDGIDEVPETSGEAADETNVRELVKSIATIVGEKTASAMYKQIAKELRRMGYDNMVSESLLNEEVIDLSMFKLAPDKRKEVGLLLMKSLRPVGADINLGGEILNAAELSASDKQKGVSLAGLSDIIPEPQRASAVKQIIYAILSNKGIPVEQEDLKENKILSRWQKMALIR